MEPKVSICVPVYKAEDYIERCSRSIFEQTLQDIEIIFINDCSPDRSWAILKSIIEEYPHRKSQIKLIENPENVGPGVSRQKCAKVANGAFIYFADSDDWLEPSMLERMYEVATKNKADIVGCQVNIIPRSGKPFRSNYRTDLSKEEWISNMILMPDLSISIALWTRMIRRNIYERTIVGEDTIKDLVRFEDFLNVVKCHYYSNKIVWIEDPLYNHDWSNLGSVTKKKDKRAFDSYIRQAYALEIFFHEKDVNLYDSEISIFKTRAKNQYITNVDFFDPSKWRDLWPELNKNKNVSRKQRIMMWLASHKFDSLLYVLVKLYHKRRGI